MTTPPTLNGIRATSVRLLAPWRGVWIADVDLDPEVIALAPTSGPAILSVGGTTLKGTVDPRGSGSFVASGRARVVGGAGGWDQPVTAQHWQSDAGITSTMIFAATAALVAETVIDEAPEAFVSFVRPAGAASEVFRDRDWWVDFLGITHAGTRLPAIADTSLELLEWDPAQQRAVVACDVPIVPGTVLVDPRLNGTTVTVRDVEQTWSKEGGARATLWCAAKPAGRLMSALTGLVRRAAGTAYLKVYRYRIVLQADNTVQLQAIQPAAGMPDTLPLDVWTGMQGVTAELLPSGEALVEFVDGDPSQPIVRGFRADDVPTILKLNASAQVQLAGGTTPLAFAPYVAALVTAITGWASGFGATGSTPALHSDLAALATAITGALAGIPPATTKTVAE